MKFFSPSLILIWKKWIQSTPDPQFFKNNQSDPVLIHLCKTMNFYFALKPKPQT